MRPLFRLHSLVSAAFLTLSFALHAETITNSTQALAHPQFAAFVFSREVIAHAFDHARESDKKFGIACDRDYQVEPEAVEILNPVSIASDAEVPESGAWKLNYSAIRCGEAKRYNSIFVAAPGRPLRAIAFYPGHSLASATVIRDALTRAYAIAGAATARDNCEDIRVFDMGVLAEPRGTGNWKEEWIFFACGKKIPVEMTFTSDKRGRTVFNASPGKSEQSGNSLHKP